MALCARGGVGGHRSPKSFHCDLHHRGRVAICCGAPAYIPSCLKYGTEHPLCWLCSTQTVVCYSTQILAEGIILGQSSLITQQSERERLVGLEHCVSSNSVNENQRHTNLKKFFVIVSVVGQFSRFCFCDLLF